MILRPTLALLALVSCGSSPEAPATHSGEAAGGGPISDVRSSEASPAPTDPRRFASGDARGEETDRAGREAWIEEMHRAAPDVDWRRLEEDNRTRERLRRNALARAADPTGRDPSGRDPTGRDPSGRDPSGRDPSGRGVASASGHPPWIWEEVGSRNQAGHTRCAALGAERGGERALYVGSALGGLWRGTTEGADWTPLSDSVYGGVDDVVVIEPSSPTSDDILVMRSGASLLRSDDGGATWTTTNGLERLVSGRRMVRAADAFQTIYLFGTANVPGTGTRSALFASIDEGRSFAQRASFGISWPGDVWVPRTAALGGSAVYVLQAGRLHVSTDDGFTFGTPLILDTGATEGDLVGSEAGGPTLYAALRQPGGDWNLHRSDDGGASAAFVRTLNAFWGATTSMAAFAFDPTRLVYAGVEAWVSTDSGVSASRINTWGSYYADPANRLHADIRGMSPLVVPDAFGERDVLYINTDGGTYVTNDGGASVQNLCLEGLGVGQFYSTHTSSLDPARISGGTQDQGYQVGLLQPSFGAGPSTPFDQLISGDYGHLTSGDGTHRFVYSTYPGFVLIQDGETSPVLRTENFPSGVERLWLPPVVADPADRRRFFFLADRLWRYTKSGNSWSPAIWSNEDFGAGASRYLSALAFAPSNSARAYAVTDAGRLYRSSDGGVTWMQSASTGPGSHYFYGSSIVVDPADADHAFVAGSGYSGPAVRETTDGGVTWIARGSGLPPTLVHDIAWSPDGSGDLFAAAEAGAYHFEAATGLWSNAMGSEAPATTYWTVETVAASERVRFGTYGRGIWDLALVDGSGPIGVTYCSPAVPNASGVPGRCMALGSPFVADNDVRLTADSLPPSALGYFIVSRTQGVIPAAGGSIGTLCLFPPFGRYVARFQNSGATGSFAIDIDVTAIPQPTTNVAAQPGETWFFQAWFRDALAGIPTSNFTDAVAVRFR